MQSNPPELPLQSPPTSNLILDGYISAIKIGLSVICPGVGPVVAEGLGTVVGYQGKVVLENWLEDVHRLLLHLGDRVAMLESPEKANELCSIILTAGQAAARCHQSEKLDALKAAVINTAVAPIENTDERAVFVRFIEELTPTHLRMLRIISEKSQDFRNTTEYVVVFKIIQKHDMNLPNDDDCYLYFRELVNRDLIRTHSKLGSTDSGDGKVYMRERLVQQKKEFLNMASWRAVALSPTGERFMQFITQPPPHSA